MIHALRTLLCYSLPANGIVSSYAYYTGAHWHTKQVYVPASSVTVRRAININIKDRLIWCENSPDCRFLLLLEYANLMTKCSRQLAIDARILDHLSDPVRQIAVPVNPGRLPRITLIGVER
jgi:hypothetical protein